MSNSLNQFSTLLKTSQVLAKQYGKTEEYENLSKLLEHGKDKSLVLLVCGEFKSGKSSFVNAFLGEEICPVADGIATSAVSIIKYGKTAKVTRYFGTVEEDVEDAGLSVRSEEIGLEDIPRFAKGTASEIDNTVYLEIEIPNKVLSEGLVLIDTPGIGSLDPRHLFLTRQALPKADAFFFVTDTVDPLLEPELAFIKEGILPLNKPFEIVLSKSDLVERDALSTFRVDAEAKASRSLGVDIRCIPVSSSEWGEYNRTSSERRKKNSNCEAVLAALDAFYAKKEESVESAFRSAFVDYLSSVRKEIERSIVELSSDGATVIESYRSQLEELKRIRDMILDPDSDFRNNINSIIESSQDKVFQAFSRDSVLLSTDKLEDVLKNPRALEENSDKFVIGEINKEIRRMGSGIDEQIDAAISDVVDELKEFIDNLPVDKKDNNVNVDGETAPITHTLSEKFVSVTRQVLPFIGVSTIGGSVAGLGLGLTAGILGLTSIAALPFIAGGIGIVTGLCFVVQSIKGTNRQELLAHLRKQMTPRINIAMNEMRSYIQKRYSLLNKAVVKAFKTIAKDMTEKMQEKVKALQEFEQDSKKKAQAQKDLQNHLNMASNLIAQAQVLNTNPFK